MLEKYYLWLIIGLVLLMLEVGTPGLFYFISFACGSFAASLSAYLGHTFEMQCATALGISIVSFFIMRSYFVQSKKHGAKTTAKTNIDALIGKQATVLDVIEPHKIGRVKVHNEEWPAFVQENMVLQKGTLVTVAAIQGNKLLVKKSS